MLSVASGCNERGSAWVSAWQVIFSRERGCVSTWQAIFSRSRVFFLLDCRIHWTIFKLRVTTTVAWEKIYNVCWRSRARTMIGASACKFQMNEKLMFIPRGRAVPSLKISRISSLFRWMLLPVQSLIPRISASNKVWSKPLKCSATGKLGDFFSLLLRCSPKQSRRVRPVSPMLYIFSHATVVVTRNLKIVHLPLMKGLAF